MDIKVMILSALSLVPFFIINLKYDYDKAVKKHGYCTLVLLWTQQIITKDMNESLKLPYLFFTVASAFLLFCVPLYIKNKNNITVLNVIAKWGIGYFMFILFFSILAILD